MESQRGYDDDCVVNISIMAFLSDADIIRND